ncbi:Uncharacterized protein dnm_081520 [Desulfonema magnum]|uniref:Uncharacterized protein n=1 Tax=Desulfonema magnum TaxID=45655 RepID=A0A975BUX3_9BACT|nr:Uncharacterized protein dnm_081520 [Desulfonema magnum]
MKILLFHTPDFAEFYPLIRDNPLKLLKPKGEKKFEYAF